MTAAPSSWPSPAFSDALPPPEPVHWPSIPDVELGADRLQFQARFAELLSAGRERAAAALLLPEVQIRWAEGSLVRWAAHPDWAGDSRFASDLAAVFQTLCSQGIADPETFYHAASGLPSAWLTSFRGCAPKHLPPLLEEPISELCFGVLSACVRAFPPAEPLSRALQALAHPGGHQPARTFSIAWACSKALAGPAGFSGWRDAPESRTLRNALAAAASGSAGLQSADAPRFEARLAASFDEALRTLGISWSDPLPGSADSIGARLLSEGQLLFAARLGLPFDELPRVHPDSVAPRKTLFESAFFARAQTYRGLDELFPSDAPPFPSEPLFSEAFERFGPEALIRGFSDGSALLRTLREHDFTSTFDRWAALTLLGAAPLPTDTLSEEGLFDDHPWVHASSPARARALALAGIAPADLFPPFDARADSPKTHFFQRIFDRESARSEIASPAASCSVDPITARAFNAAADALVASGSPMPPILDSDGLEIHPVLAAVQKSNPSLARLFASRSADLGLEIDPKSRSGATALSYCFGASVRARNAAAVSNWLDCASVLAELGCSLGKASAERFSAVCSAHAEWLKKRPDVAARLEGAVLDAQTPAKPSAARPAAL